MNDPTSQPSSTRRSKYAFAAAAVLVLLAACQDLEAGYELPDPGLASFQNDIEPVLVERCAFPVCHGNAERPFRLRAPARYRPDRLHSELEHPLDEQETAANYKMVRGFADLEAPGGALLLLKPLDIDAGGYFHRARGSYRSTDVFASENDCGYRLIANWLGEPVDVCPPKAAQEDGQQGGSS